MVPEWLEAVVRNTLDEPIRDCWRPTGGALADTYVLELDGPPGRVVCKRGGASIWSGDVVEPLVTSLVATETDLPVPDVLASGSLENADGPDRWAIYEYIDGDVPTPDGPGRRDWLVDQAGSLLGRLHGAFSFDRRGGLARDGSTLVLDSAGASEVLESRFARRLVTAGPATEPVVKPVLDHGDFRPANLLVDGPLAGDGCGQGGQRSEQGWRKGGRVDQRGEEGGRNGGRGGQRSEQGWRKSGRGGQRSEQGGPKGGRVDQRSEQGWRKGGVVESDDELDGERPSVLAVLDWGNAHVTHPGLALGRAEVRFVDLPARSAAERRILRDRFRAAYEAHRPIPAAIEAELSTFKLLWFTQVAVNLLGVARTPRGRTQLRRQLRNLRAGKDVFPSQSR